MQDDREAGRSRRGEARRQGAKPPGGSPRAGAKAVRLQIYLSEPTAKRLGVHCALVGQDRSAVVEKLLAAWLKSAGRGRELWDKADGRVNLAGEGIDGTEAA